MATVDEDHAASHEGSGLRFRVADAPEKVAGRTQYVADIQLRGMLHARLLRSPHAHARIMRIDTSKAQGAQGRARRADRRRHPDSCSRAPRRARHAVLAIDRVVFVGPAGGGGGRRRAGDRRGGARPDRGRVRGAAGRRSTRLKSMQAGAPRVADAGTEADTSEALAHSGVAPTESESRRRRAEHRPEAPSCGAATWRRRSPRPTSSSRRRTASRWCTRATSSRTPRWPTGTAHGSVTLWASTQGSFNTRSEVADVLGHSRGEHQGHPDGVRRRLRRQDPRARRADHRVARRARPGGRSATS